MWLCLHILVLGHKFRIHLTHNQCGILILLFVQSHLVKIDENVPFFRQLIKRRWLFVFCLKFGWKSNGLFEIEYYSRSAANCILSTFYVQVAMHAIFCYSEEVWSMYLCSGLWLKSVDRRFCFTICRSLTCLASQKNNKNSVKYTIIG